LQFFLPLTQQTLALLAAAIHCGLSEYATAKPVTIMFSHDEYRGEFCPSTVIDCITAEAIAPIEFELYMLGLHYTPPSPRVLLRYNTGSSIPVGALQSPSVLLHPLGALQPELVLQAFIQFHPFGKPESLGNI
jgi:hypothetical protein